MNTKHIGGILMITGNAIGGGMLALPLVVAQTGFTRATLFLIVCWAIMLAGCLLILEVNLWFPADSHLISMARATLGRTGAMATGLCYALLLYSLLAAYIAGGASFLQGLMQKIHLPISSACTATVFVLIFGSIVYKGIRSVDTFNRMLMAGKLLIYILLIALIFPFISIQRLGQVQSSYLSSSGLSIMITSFGFAAIVPSLRSYFHSDIQQLRRIIIIGSLIPLLCYILWNAAISGVIPLQGGSGLIDIAHAKQPARELIVTLSTLLNKNLITGLAWGFTSICLATSFLGVGISLFDFLKDGFALKKTVQNNCLTALLTFVPPLSIVLFFPGVFISALSYAGIWCVSLLALLPALMTWSGRYVKGYAFSYRVTGGKFLLSVIIVGPPLLYLITTLMTGVF